MHARAPRLLHFASRTRKQIPMCSAKKAANKIPSARAISDNAQNSGPKFSRSQKRQARRFVGSLARNSAISPFLAQYRPPAPPQQAHASHKKPNPGGNKSPHPQMAFALAQLSGP